MVQRSIFRLFDRSQVPLVPPASFSGLPGLRGVLEEEPAGRGAVEAGLAVAVARGAVAGAVVVARAAAPGHALGRIREEILRTRKELFLTILNVISGLSMANFGLHSLITYFLCLFY